MRRRESSIANRRRPATLTASYDPNGGSTPGFALGSTTSTSGAGRSAILPLRLGPEAMQLAKVHQVVDPREEEPFAAAQVADEGMVERAGLRLVPGDRL